MPAVSNELPEGYRSFTPSLDDIFRATDFFNLVEISEWGVPDFDESEVREEWEELDLGKSVVLVEDKSGTLVASMTLVDKNGVTWEAFGYVHPDHQQKGLGSWIIDWSESTARSREDETEDSYRVSILNYTSTVNTAAQQLFANHGYAIDRVFRRMRIELSERPAAVDWPVGFQTRPFERERDERSFYDTLDTSFAGHWTASPRTFESWSDDWLTGEYDTSLWVQLLHVDQIVGICCGKPMSDGGWIGYVGVLPDYRRRGLAKLILQDSFGRFWDRGIKQVDLGVDSQNRQSAIDLYLGSGMHETHSYETNRKVLREGTDWREE